MSTLDSDKDARFLSDSGQENQINSLPAVDPENDFRTASSLALKNFKNLTEKAISSGSFVPPYSKFTHVKDSMPGKGMFRKMHVIFSK